MKFKIEVELKTVFQPYVYPTIEKYLRREIKAHEAATELGWSRATWERNMAGIFSEGNSTITEVSE